MNKGFTLIEALISLSLFMLLSMGLLFLWQHSANTAERAIQKQNALDNLFVAMDAFTTNIQFSHTLELTTDSRDILRQLDMRGYNSQGQAHTFIFTFNQNARPQDAIYKSLFFGGQQFAYGIESIRIIHIPKSHFEITIISSRVPGLYIEGSVDVRHKFVTER